MSVDTRAADIEDTPYVEPGGVVEQFCGHAYIHGAELLIGHAPDVRGVERGGMDQDVSRP